jgi:hypothetical protein
MASKEQLGLNRRTRRPTLITFWLSARPVLDWVPAVGAALGVLAALQFHSTLGQRITDSVLSDSDWSTYMQTLSGVSAALLGFGATAVALVLAIGGGRRGKRVLSQAGADLNRMLASCLGSLCAVTLVLAIAAGFEPSLCRSAFGAVLTAVVTLMVLRIARLWYFLHRLLEVFIRDAAANTSESPQTRPEDEDV